MFSRERQHFTKGTFYSLECGIRRLTHATEVSIQEQLKQKFTKNQKTNIKTRLNQEVHNTNIQKLQSDQAQNATLTLVFHFPEFFKLQCAVIDD